MWIIKFTVFAVELNSDCKMSFFLSFHFTFSIAEMDFNMNAAAAAGTTTTTASPRSPRPPQPTTLATGPFSPRKRAAHTAATMFVDRLIEDATGHDDDIDEDGAAPHHDDTDADATDADTASIVVEILQPVSVSRRTSPVRTARISIPPPSTTSTTSKQAKPTPPTAPTFTPTPGRLVWAKIGRFPYWPGQVVDAAVYDPRGLIAKPSSGGGGGGGRGRKTVALSVKAPVHHLVHFYGTHDL